MNPEQQLRLLWDRAQIIETVSSYGIGVDTRDFDMFRSLFTDEVTVDYTSMFGGEPYTLRADDLVINWKGLLTAFESTQHIISNHVVKMEDAAATCTAHFQAHHILLNKRGGCSWTVAGYYVHNLVRVNDAWKIRAVKLVNLWGEGNFDLVKMAEQIAATGKRG